MAEALVFKSGKIEPPERRSFPQYRAGFVIGIQCRSEALVKDPDADAWVRVVGPSTAPFVQRLVTAIKTTYPSVPIYLIETTPGELWARDRFVSFAGTYVRRHLFDIGGEGFIFAEGGYCLDNGKTAIVYNPNKNIPAEVAVKALASVSSLLRSGMDFVLLDDKFLGAEHLDMRFMLIDHTIYEGDTMSLSMKTLSDLGFSGRRIKTPLLSINIPLFEVEGEKVALVPDFASDELKEEIRKHGIRVVDIPVLTAEETGLHIGNSIPADVRSIIAFAASAFLEEELQGGIRCATNWVDNPGILDFFGIRYTTI